MINERKYVLIENAMLKAAHMLTLPGFDYYPHFDYKVGSNVIRFNLAGAHISDQWERNTTYVNDGDSDFGRADVAKFLRYISLGSFAKVDSPYFDTIWEMHRRHGAPLTWESKYLSYLRECVTFWSKIEG